MGFTRIDHVGILVDDLEVGRHVYCDGWGLDVDEHRSPWPNGRPGTFDDVTSIEIPIGEMYIEISKPNDSDSPAGQFVANRPGMYYVSLASDNFDDDVNVLEAKGMVIERRSGDGNSVMLDPGSTLGVRFQIVREDNYYAHPYYKGDGTLQGMAHIGLAARSADEIRHLFVDLLGFNEDSSQERGQDGPGEDRDRGRAASDPVHLIEFPIGGSVIEISIPTTDDSGTAKLVAQRATQGATFHHICPFAKDVHRSIETGVAAGLQQIGSIPDKGQAETFVAWFHPRTCAGVLTEIWNRTPGGEHAQHTHGMHPGPDND